MIRNKTILYFLMGIYWCGAGCAPKGGGILGSSTPMSELVDAKTKSAPFAYDLAVDTISYNSCISETVKTSVIHGFKISSSEGFVDTTGLGTVKAGVKLRTDFLQWVGKNFAPDYPSTSVTPTQIQEILQNSDYNKDAYIQFALRKTKDLTSVPDLISPGSSGTSTNGQLDRDVQVINQLIGTGFIGYSLSKDVKFASGVLQTPGQRVYNLSNDSSVQVIQGTLGFHSTDDDSYAKTTSSLTTENYGRAESYADEVRAQLTAGNYYLTATFGGNENIDTSGTATTTNNHIDLLKRPTSTTQDLTKAFGKGFLLKFKSAGSQAGWLKNQLYAVTEVDLDNKTPAGGTTWQCYQYVIARADHWNNNRYDNTQWVNNSTQVEPACLPLMTADLTNDRLNQIRILRRHYPESNWNIGLFVPAATKSGYVLPARAGLKLCLSPKSGECYLPTTNILSTDAEKALDVGIQYDETKECYLTAGASYTTATTLDQKRKLGRCAQFASICVRNSLNF